MNDGQTGWNDVYEERCLAASSDAGDSRQK